jgi:ketosteroid isomerase-like protein
MDESDLIQRGLRAWTEGDLDALEALLDPQVTLRWVERGAWDCTGRDEVMLLLRQRRAGHGGRSPSPVRVSRLDARTFIVATDDPVDHDRPQPFRVATRITVTDGKVVTMQQYRDDPSAGPF